MKSHLSHLFTLLILMALACPWVQPVSATAQPLPAATVGILPRPSTSADAAAPMRQPDFGKVPLLFIRNTGQMDKQVTYYVPGRDKTLYFTPRGVTFALTAPLTPTTTAPTAVDKWPGRAKAEPAAVERWTVKLDFVDANPDVRPVGQAQAEAHISYFKGRPDEWQAGLPTFQQLVYADLWPGVDLVYTGTQDRLKYEFRVRPGADPRQIRLAYRGVTGVSVNPAGQLVVSTPVENFVDDMPLAYQDFPSGHGEVAVAYTLQDRAGRVSSFGNGAASGAVYNYGFAVGNYDATRPLVIDPAVLVYAGYIGGAYGDWGNGIAVDSAGNTYVIGYGWSDQATFPVTVGPDLTYNGVSDDGDAFVAKVNAAGTALVYAGYIGGNGRDFGTGIAVDSAGNAYVTGWTISSEDSFPVTVGPDLTENGDNDAFVAKVNAAGTALVYAGYIGGAYGDLGLGIAVDSAGNAYVTGWTISDQTTFPVKGGPDLTFNGGDWDTFVAKVNAAGTALVYAGYIGGSSDEMGLGIAVDGVGNAYVTGQTGSDQTTFPVKGGPDLTFNGDSDAFVAKVNAAGTALVYAGYLGGSSGDEGLGIAVDSVGNAYITGWTNSDQTTFPVAVGPDLTFNGGAEIGRSGDAFVAKVNAAGTALIYAGYIGGAGSDGGAGIAVDKLGNAYVTGYTMSDQTTFPVKCGPGATYHGGKSGDAFVTKVNAAGTALVYAGYIGGAYADGGAGIAVDGLGNAYITGATNSDQTTFPVAVGPDLTFNGGDEKGDSDGDAFVAKVKSGDYAVGGRITDHAANPVADVTVSSGPCLSAITDASGYYTITSIITGTYTLKPTLNAYIFAPPSRTVSVPSDATEQDFTAALMDKYYYLPLLVGW